MHSLAAYVGAILHQDSPVAIVRHETRREDWQDQGFDVHKEETTYWFDNGAVIQREIEQDTFPTDLACAECWIAYRVLALGRAQSIEPLSQTFNTACREKFWLAYHRAS